MAQTPTPRALSRSTRIYRALLRAYPPDFRHRHGAAMVQLFRDSCRDAYRERGGAGLLAVWGHTLGDLCVSAVRERGAALSTALRRVLGRHRDTPGWAFAPPALGALLQVLPVAQTRQQGRWTLTFISMEHWAGACIASFTVRWQMAPEAPFPLVGLDLQATDDCGGRYVARPSGGSGGSNGEHGHHDSTYILTPALDPAARSLRFVVRLQLLAQDGSPPRLVPVRTEPGTWDFTVAVPATAAATI